MPRRKKINARRNPVVVYLTEDEKESLRQRSIEADITMSDYMRRLLLANFDGWIWNDDRGRISVGFVGASEGEAQ